MEINPDNEQFIREDLRKQYGNGIYAERIINKLEKLFDQDKKVVVADGLYSWTEYKIFKEMYGDRAIVIAITAPKQLRHQRLSTRKTRPLTAEEVTKRDYAEIENIEKGGPIANADYTLVNDKNKEKLLKDLGDLILVLDLPGTH
jgi:dephospho-CoA kinase